MSGEPGSRPAERLDLILRLMPTACLVLDESDRVVLWNRAAEETFGWTADEVTGRDVIALLVPADAESEVKGVFAAARGHERPVSNVSENMTKGGARIRCEWRHSRLVDGDGRVVGLVALATDVTERRHSEETLRRRARQQAAVAGVGRIALGPADLGAFLGDVSQSLASVLDVEIAGVFEATPDGAALVLRTAFGVPDAPIGRVFPADDPVTHAGRQMSAKAPVIYRGEEESGFALGPFLSSLGVASVLSVAIDVGPRRWGVLGACSRSPRTFDEEDLVFLRSMAVVVAAAVEHRHAADALLESEARYRLLFERNVAGVARTASDGRFLECNEAFAGIYGFSPEELKGVRAETLYDEPADREALLAEVVERGLVRGREIRMRHRSGHVVWVLANVGLFPSTAGERVFEVTITDVTTRKRLEEQLGRLEKMEAIGRLAGGIAHDFNNVLTAILGYADLALARATDDLRPDLEEIRDAGRRAADLTAKLLALGRRQVMAPAVLDPNEEIRNLASMVERILGEDVDLRLVLPDGLWKIRVDASQLERVLMNLLFNARDAMPEGGRLTIETANVELDVTDVEERPHLAPGAYVRISVADDGVGMDEEVLSHVFEPFFTTKPKGKGTGLGLPSSHGIVLQSGGDLSIYSEPGVGTTVNVLLPAVTTTDSGSAVRISTRRMPVAGGGERILVAEDDPKVLRFVARALREAGYEVLESTDGAAALAELDRAGGRVDLLLTDVVMPRLRGPALARAARQRRPDLPVVFMSGYAEGALPDLADVNFLQKPVTRDALLRMLRIALDARP